MAPDVNSLPTSPRKDKDKDGAMPAAQTSQPSSTAASRRESQTMPPPTIPASASPVQHVNNHHLPMSHRSPTMSTNETALPLRHPRPMTAAELYLECEKEQEAVVNRLTRELTALRAQTASVASNASHSSTSTGVSLLPVDISDPNPTHQMTGATHPTAARRERRSSSSLSNRSSVTNTSTQVQAGSTANIHTANHPATTNASTTLPMTGISQASADRAAAATGGSGGSLSRQPSVSASGRSTPARHSLDLSRNNPTTTYNNLTVLPPRPSLSRSTSQTSTQAVQHAPYTSNPLPHPISPSANTKTNATTANTLNDHRADLESLKLENETLRQRVRALEFALRSQQQQQTQPRRRDSSTSASTTSYSHERSAGGSAMVQSWDSGVRGVAGPRERSGSGSGSVGSSRRGTGVGFAGVGSNAGVGAEEEIVRVGESAGSAGLSSSGAGGMGR